MLGMVLVAALALGVFGLLGGLDRRRATHVAGGGTAVVRVTLVDAAVGFDVTPDVVAFEPGTHVVLDVVNDGHEAHDLAVPGGPRTRRLAPGATERLDLGVPGHSATAYCTLPEHRLAGMSVELRRT